MPHVPEFTEDARTEFDVAFDWYAERSLGAAIAFVTEIDVAIALPKRHPGYWRNRLEL